MTYQVLSRKLRPTVFQEVIGQDHVIKSLVGAIKSNRIGHAYLFSGTRGVGKTTVARLFAKAVRCQAILEDGNPCGKCGPCLEFNTESSMDIIEIDGASNNSVENIREIVSNVQYLPTSGKYRIYIIDEVHQLSSSAFNALLKTLEEPPAHVIFIFATTEPEKILPTVLSRCQKFDFRSVSHNDLVKFIQTVNEREDIIFENNEVIREIAIQGNGSVRDVLSIMDQILSFSNGETITEDILVYSVGMARSSQVKKIAYGMLLGVVKEVSQNYRQLMQDNISIQSILRSLMNLFFEMIEKIDDPNYEHAKILEDFSYAELFWIYEILAKDSIWIMESMDTEKVFEILLQKISLRRTIFNNESGTIKGKKKEVIPENNNILATEIGEGPAYLDEEVPVGEPEECNQNLEPIIEPVMKKHSWGDFIDYLYKKSPASASNLEQGNVINPLEVTSDSVVVELGFGESERVFYDYLSDRDVFAKLKINLSDFFDRTVDEIQIKLFLVDEVQKKEYNFQSRAEINLEKLEEQKKNKKHDLLNHDQLKEAEKLFGVKVDKVILKD